MIQKKVCMLGSFAVGKTSLVKRFAQGSFDERYLTTVGVRMDRKEIEVEGTPVQLILWDLHGEDELQRVRATYLRGSAGFLLVADGTRPGTLDTARELREMGHRAVGEVPSLLLMNKADLRGEWELEPGLLSGLDEAGWNVRETSAKTGEGVESAFAELARRMLAEAP